MRVRIWDEDEIGAAPAFDRRIGFASDKPDRRVRKGSLQIGRRKEKQFGKIDDDVRGTRKKRLELISKSSPPRPDFPHQRSFDVAQRREHTAALHPDEHLVELERVEIEQLPVD